MNCIHNLTPDIYWVGAGDRRLALFENLFPLENGVTYNSHLIMDESIALIDTVDNSVTRQFFQNLAEVLDGRQLDYLVVNHMEPDHCANIEEICRRWPDVKLVGNAKTFQYIYQFYGDITCNRVEVKEGDEICLGKHTLRFVMAPMVHWPEVMFTLETTEGILFSADAFGTFGGYTGNIFTDELDYQNLYLDEARRYYTNIVGKFGQQVTAVLNKLGGAAPKMIAPLHGPILRGDTIQLLLDKYVKWASYQPEERGVVLAFASMYGNTEEAMHKLASMLSERGVKDMRMFDASKTHYSYIIAEMFKYSHIVLASPTYNMHLHGAMDFLLQDMIDLNLQNKGIALLGNGTWAPAAHNIMRDMVCQMKNTSVIGEPMVIRSTLTKEQLPEMEALAGLIAKDVLAG